MVSSSPKTALVIGATGLIGNQLTHKLCQSVHYERVKVLVRKPLGWQHARLQEIQFDFDRPNGLLTQADDIFCCLGTTMKKAGSKEAFHKVDYDYPMAVARLAREQGATQYAIVTAMGADVDSMFYYNRVKGEVERDLAALNYPALLIFRPSLLLGNRSESRLGEKLGEGFMKLFNPLIPAKYKAIDADRVAEFMCEKAQQGLAGLQVFESDQMQ
jgi:uncharacterized protein YbjT (DUF2867 family)